MGNTSTKLSSRREKEMGPKLRTVKAQPEAGWGKWEGKTLNDCQSKQIGKQTKTWLFTFGTETNIAV